MRHAAQCVGRVLIGKADYGLMIFADKRFARSDKRGKLPRWINQYIAETSSNLSTDMATNLAKRFVRHMAQPFDSQQTGISLWTIDHVKERQEQDKYTLVDDTNDNQMEIDEEQDEDNYIDNDNINDEDVLNVPMITA